MRSAVSSTISAPSATVRSAVLVASGHYRALGVMSTCLGTQVFGARVGTPRSASCSGPAIGASSPRASG